MIPEIEIIMIACLVATAAAIPGVFLILRKVAMMSDAISHSVLLGIVIMFFIVKDIHSPLLIIAAAVTGLITVGITEALIKTNRVKKDAAIGLIFPAFFAAAIILINLFVSDIHIDQDSVLLGEIAFAPFNRLIIKGVDLGPIAMWIMSCILFLNCTFIGLFYKELKLSTFDTNLATSFGFSPLLLNYGLMSCVSITAVGAFDTVGAILIVALMITPPATAYLLTNRLSKMIQLSVLIGCGSSILGYFLAIIVDGSIAGGMCSIAGVIFILALLFSNKHGLLLKYYTYKKQKVEFSATLLTVQLFDHENTKKESFENSYNNLIQHMEWSKKRSEKVIGYALSNKMITKKRNHFFLTDLGREIAKKAISFS